jgi:hypothetical protein
MTDPVPMEGDLPFKAWTEFRLARASAIKQYSMLEQAMCECLACFGDMSNFAAGTIFFKINNARAAREILLTLKRRKYGGVFSDYWKSLMKLAGGLADQRNQIIHWGEAAGLYESDSDKRLHFEALLKPPNYWGWTEETPDISKEDLNTFELKSLFVQESLQAFLKVLNHKLVAEEEKTWLEICRQPATYPTPADHPLHRTTTRP